MSLLSGNLHATWRAVINFAKFTTYLDLVEGSFKKDTFRESGSFVVCLTVILAFLLPRETKRQIVAACDVRHYFNPQKPIFRGDFEIREKARGKTPSCQALVLAQMTILASIASNGAPA